MRISPVEFVLLPHFAETIQPDAFPVDRIFLEHFIKDILIEHLPTYLEERHEFRVLEFPPHQEVKFPKDVNNHVLLLLRLLDPGLGIYEGDDKVNPGL